MSETACYQSSLDSPYCIPESLQDGLDFLAEALGIKQELVVGRDEAILDLMAGIVLYRFLDEMEQSKIRLEILDLPLSDPIRMELIIRKNQAESMGTFGKQKTALDVVKQSPALGGSPPVIHAWALSDTELEAKAEKTKSFEFWLGIFGFSASISTVNDHGGKLKAYFTELVKARRQKRTGGTPTIKVGRNAFMVLTGWSLFALNHDKLKQYEAEVKRRSPMVGSSLYPDYPDNN